MRKLVATIILSAVPLVFGLAWAEQEIGVSIRSIANSRPRSRR